MPRQYTPRVHAFCKNCGKEFMYQPAQKRKYCCRACYLEEIPHGETHPLWGGGRSRQTKRGYIMITTPDGRRMHEHRYIMEQHLQRRLRKNEEVHHINKNTSDNRIENLMVVSPTEHAHLHYDGIWAMHYSRCVCCGRTDRKHASNGLCNTCYKRQYRSMNKAHHP